MRRIAFILLALGLVGIYWACSTDAPAPTPPNQGGTKSTALVITLFTTDANPPAGNCTLVQAIVNFNGQAVPDGTGVSFSTDFGGFANNQPPNGPPPPVVSIVTSKGSAIAALCSSSTGTAFVTARVTVNGVSGKSDQLKIVFQPGAVLLPFITGCSPNFGSNAGGTVLTINGGRFPSDPTGAATRATVTAAGITREALVQSVTTTAVTLVLPAFPEATAPSVPVSITLIFFANTSSPVTLAVPNCFAFGTASSSTPTITALLPSSGSNDGGTRVSIIGSGFTVPLQVFFDALEAQVVSVSFSQVVVISPARTGAPAPAAVRLHEVTSGTDSNTIQFQYEKKVQITSWNNNFQRIDQAFTPVTIFGSGFQAPVAVGLAGVAAFVTSVSATEIQVIPANPLVTGCADISGAISVTNIDTGDFDSKGTFSYLVSITAPTIVSVNPQTGPPGTVISVTGANLGLVTRVTMGGHPANFSHSGGGLSITVPDPGLPSPVCPSVPGPTVDVTLIDDATTCTVTSGTAFTYILPCVTPTPTAVPTPTPTP